MPINQVWGMGIPGSPTVPMVMSMDEYGKGHRYEGEHDMGGLFYLTSLIGARSDFTYPPTVS